MFSPPIITTTTTTGQDPIKPKIQLEDFKVKVHESTILYPAQETLIRKGCFLSNLDQPFSFYASTLHFFSANADFPFEIVVQRLRTSLEKVLVAYHFAAGSLKFNHHLRRLEMDCDATGAGFVVASSEFSLDEIGDLACANPGYLQLAPVKLDNLETFNTTHQPLCIFQVTSFKCGGLSLSLSASHTLFDATAAKMFFENLASQTFGEDKPLAVTPCNDRHLLVARSPPLVEFPHPELKLRTSNVVPQQEEKLVSKIFKLSSKQINYLKDKAKSAGTETKPPIKITSFNVVAALIWRCKALSSSTMDIVKSKDSFQLQYAIDIRSRVNPPLPSSYSGNGAMNAYASLKYIELETRPFWEIVGEVYGGQTRVTDEYVKSVLDWIEINKGVATGNYFISSFQRVGFEQVVFPWGKPVYSLPVVSDNKYVCFLLPPQRSSDEGNAMNVVVTLPPKEMAKFQSLFYDFFEN